jgi:hypothetical protein
MILRWTARECQKEESAKLNSARKHALLSNGKFYGLFGGFIVQNDSSPIIIAFQKDAVNLAVPLEE